MFYFIVNPSSRSGQGMQVWFMAKKILDERKLAYKVFFTKHLGHGTELARKLATKAAQEMIIVIGGDGTMNECLNGLDPHSVYRIGFVPVGSGNDFARGLQLPTDPQTALEELLLTPEPEPLDIGTLHTANETKYFGISCGMGYDAAVCYEALGSPMKKILNKLHLGKLIYSFCAVKLLFSFQPTHMEFILDEKKRFSYKKVYLVTGMNLAYEGGGFHFCPDADYQDGLLDFMIVHSLPKAAILLLFPTAYFAKHTKIPGISFYRGKELKIVSDIPCHLHRDGELSGIESQVTMGIHEHGMEILR